MTDAIPGSAEYFEEVAEAVQAVARGVGRAIRRIFKPRWQKKKRVETWPGAIWREAKIIFWSSLGLALGAWVWRQYHELLGRRLFNESILEGEWKDVVHHYAVDVDYRASR